MFWIPLLMAAQSMKQGQDAVHEAKRLNTIDESNVLADNKLRVAGNKLSAAVGALNRFQQSQRNKTHLKNAGAQIDATTTNMARMQADAVEGSVDRRISAAEEAGAMAARFGGAGVQGGTVQMLNATNKLRNARIEEITTSAEAAQEYDMALGKRAQIESMVLGLEDTMILDTLNYQSAQARPVYGPSAGEIAMGAAMTFAQAYAQFGGKAGTKKPQSQISDGIRYAPLGSGRNEMLA